MEPNPANACSDSNFKSHELCFKTPGDGAARAELLSESFYAVILKTAEPCTITEDERLQAQSRFPKSKVFSARFFCDDDIEENISYTNVNDKVRISRRLRGADVEGSESASG